MGALRAASTTVSGWPPGFGAWARCGAQLARSLCYRHRVPSLANMVWPPSLAALASVPTLSKHQQSKGCRPAASAKGLYARPAASGCAGSQSAGSLLLPRSPASATRPGVAWSCKPAVPSGTVQQSVAGRRLRTLCRPHPHNPPGFPKRVAEAGRVEVVNPKRQNG
ncbi:hypothetical protein [Pectobacterium brasiliense]|uniref:hypothetical protein n=1 Tax=Pectobacterium brasiliense TaxID=180957 RepID=UPI0009B82C68|nr:hypothetical protein [Pectobacterium brasiliense]